MKLEEVTAKAPERNTQDVLLGVRAFKCGRGFPNTSITFNDMDPNVPWKGDFVCDRMGLTSLVGCPKKIVDGGSQYGNGLFSCHGNKLRSLKGGPEEVANNYDCSHNYLRNFVGAPERLSKKGVFFGTQNILDSLEGVPRVAFEVSLVLCEIKSLAGIHRMFDHLEMIDVSGNTIHECVLGLLLVPGLFSALYTQGTPTVNNVFKIVNEHLRSSPFGNRRVLECQNELLDAGLEAFAKL